MPASRTTPTSRTGRRAGQLVSGFGALVILIGLLAGAPLALLALAGNPLPDHVPSLDAIGTVLTSRDDGQLFLRALAIVGWAGWATFALSVLVEVPARILRRPAIRLPGLGRQQRWAAALVGSVALALAVSPAATAAAGTVATTTMAASAQPPVVGAPPLAEPSSGPAPHWLVTPPTAAAEQPVPVYRVEKGDYLGHIADRYLGDFDRYPELARLNEIRDPDRIRTGQLLHLPSAAEDGGVRQHATGLVAVPPPPGGWTEVAPGSPVPEAGQPHTEAVPPPTGAQPSATPESVTPSTPGAATPESATPESVTPESVTPAQPGGARQPDAPRQPSRPQRGGPQQPSGAGQATGAAQQPGAEDDNSSTYVVSASRAGAVEELNRPLAVSAVIAVASIVGAQVGAVFGLRGRSGRRPRFGNGRHHLPH